MRQFVDIIFAKLWGASGIALATTIATFTALVLYAFNFRKKHYVSGISSHKIYVELLKIIFASAVSGGLSLILKRFIPQSAKFFITLLRFWVIVIFVGIVYLILTWLLGSSGFEIAKGYFKRFFAFSRK